MRGIKCEEKYARKKARETNVNTFLESIFCLLNRRLGGGFLSGHHRKQAESREYFRRSLWEKKLAGHIVQEKTLVFKGKKPSGKNNSEKNSRKKLPPKFCV